MRTTLRSALLASVLAAGLAPAAIAAGPAKLLSYSDVFQDNYIQTVVDPFNKIGANKVEFVGGNSSATMLGQLRTQKDDPQLDLVIMDVTTAAIACAEGLVEPMTPATLPVLADLDPQAIQAAKGCGPGVTFDHLIIQYDADAVKPAPTSLKVLWDKKWAGKVSVSSPPNIQGLALTAILANADTGNWRNANGAFKQLAELAPDVQTFDPQPDGYTLIMSNTLDFSTNWNARAQLFHDRSKGRLGVMLPSEGTVRQINTINVVKGGKNHEAAMAFIAYALSPEAQKAFTDRMFYGPTNLKAQIAPDVALRSGAAPELKSKVVPVDWDEMVKLRDVWNNRWKREVISAGGR